MEVWALEAYGCAYTLQELLTIKSDNSTERYTMYESLVENTLKPKPQLPDTFLVLIRELNALGLDFSLNIINNNKIIQTTELNIFKNIETYLQLKVNLKFQYLK